VFLAILPTGSNIYQISFIMATKGFSRGLLYVLLEVQVTCNASTFPLYLHTLYFHALQHIFRNKLIISNEQGDNYTINNYH